MDMEEKHRGGAALLKKLEGSIAKKKRSRNGAYNHSAAEQFVTKRSKIEPIIIHAVSPPLIQAEPSSFMRIVQSLTGCPATQRRYEDEAGTGAVMWRRYEDEGRGMAMQSLASGSDASQVGSPCSSMSSTSTTTDATKYAEGFLSANLGPKSSLQVRMVENDVNAECWDVQEPMSSPSITSCSLLLDSNDDGIDDVFFVDVGISPRARIDESICFADSYFEHLLSSYDRDAYWNLTSTTAVLADVCDPLLLKEL